MIWWEESKMSNILAKLGGKGVNTLLEPMLGNWQGYSAVRDHLMAGDLDAAKTDLRNLDPATGLYAAVQRALGTGEGTIAPLVRSEGGYDAAVAQIVTLAQAAQQVSTNHVSSQVSGDWYGMNTLDAASALCGSVWTYTTADGEERQMLVSQTSAWEEVGKSGSDQAIATRDSGLVGFFSDKMRGREYHVGFVTAHSARTSGIVCVDKAKIIRGGKVRGEVGSMTKVRDYGGFDDARVNGISLADPAMPITVELRDPSTYQVGILGRSFEVQTMDKNNDRQYGRFELKKL